MKKTIVRVLAFVLVLILALGIIPLGAFAASPEIIVPELVFDKNSIPMDWSNINYWWIGEGVFNPGETIKTSNYDAHYINTADGKLYDFSGIGNSYTESLALDKKIESYIKANLPTSGTEADFEKFNKELNKYIENLYKNTTITLSKSDIKIDPYPVAPNPDNYDDAAVYEKALEAYNNAKNEWEYKYFSYFAAYTPHQHKLSRWYSDSTTHWRECLVCKKVLGQYNQFLNQNWHSDGDEDRVCDVCGADIPYHEITVIDSKGGKITVNLEEAPHRKKITASVELEEGYKLKKLHFTKVRTDGSRQEIKRRKTNKTNWWTYMPTYDLEVTAEYVKK